jgi:hypothetical protein
MQSQRSVHGLDISAGAGAKVFWFFSSEKNVLPYQGADFTWFLPGQTLRPAPNPVLLFMHDRSAIYAQNAYQTHI